MPTDTTPVYALAPLRIRFVGGGTDFPHWYRDHGGAVLSTTIDHFVRVTVAPRDDRDVRVRSLDLGELVRYRLDDGPHYDGVLDLAKAAIDRMGIDVGLDVDIESEAPPGSGLGGSSALVTAVVAAIACLDERALSCDELVRLSYAIEREDLGISGGWQDQYAAAFGGFNLIEFERDGVQVTPVEAGADALEELRKHLLLCYTGKVRRNVGLVQDNPGLLDQLPGYVHRAIVRAYISSASSGGLRDADGWRAVQRARACGFCKNVVTYRSQALTGTWSGADYTATQCCVLSERLCNAQHFRPNYGGEFHDQHCVRVHRGRSGRRGETSNGPSRGPRRLRGGCQPRGRLRALGRCRAGENG